MLIAIRDHADHGMRDDVDLADARQHLHLNGNPGYL